MKKEPKKELPRWVGRRDTMKHYHVEKEFTYRGLKCVVMMQKAGHRCGYVGVSKEHPLFGKNYTDHLEIKKTDVSDREISGIIPLMLAALDDDKRIRIDAYFQVHGGITYSDGNGKYPIPSDLWWFGFDCNHHGDRPDYEAAKELFSDDLDTIRFLKDREEFDKRYGLNTIGEIRSFDYVENQCKKLAEQLADF